jgi:hypothetical protein
VIFAHYVAIGDSMSMDLYPALDVGATAVAVALERISEAGEVAPVGAASLLYHNDEQRWPDDLGDDLATLSPGIDLRNLAQDGATLGDVFGEQLAGLEESDAPTLVTVTAGGYDLLSAAANRPRRELLRGIARDVAEAYDFLIDAVRRLRPNATVVVTTICDPSDGTGTVPGAFEGKGAVPLEALRQLNESIRKLASDRPHVLLADAHARFFGHGVTALAEDCWYWRRSLVEPNAVGASELRHLWLDAIRPLLEG